MKFPVLIWITSYGMHYTIDVVKLTWNALNKRNNFYISYKSVGTPFPNVQDVVPRAALVYFLFCLLLCRCFLCSSTEYSRQLILSLLTKQGKRYASLSSLPSQDRDIVTMPSRYQRWVWNHCIKADNGIEATCTICDDVLQTGGSTSSSIKHLTNIHGL